MRQVFPNEIPDCRERWDALLESTLEIHYALSAWFSREVPTCGLPPGHRDSERFSTP